MPSPDALLTSILHTYGPARATHESADGAAVALDGPGGGLQAAVERHGAASIAAALDPGERVVLEDDGVTLELVREGAGATLRVAWEGGPSYAEPLALAGVAPLAPAAAAQPAAPSAGPVIQDAVAALHDPTRPLAVSAAGLHDAPGALPAGGIGRVPSVEPGTLGDRAFRAAHGTAGNLVAGAMAGGIASPDLVVAMAEAGLLGFFGAGGLDLPAVDAALARIVAEVPAGRPWGANLLHNPVEPAVEERTVDLYLKHGVTRVSASAFMALTPAVVRFRLHDIHEEGGRIVTPHHVFAKVSRPEVAEPFLRPAPARILDGLVEAGHLTRAQARLAAKVPVAQDVTAEADSGGHTDRRPLMGLLPTLLRLRDRVAEEEGYAARGMLPRVGAAGGMGDPTSVHAAFAMGAAYVLTGSVNQATVEAGTSKLAKMMLATAGLADCATGPAPDMFELGAHVQVLGQGTMYAQRAQRLYDLYRRYDAIEEIPEKDRAKIERTIFRRSLDDVWTDTRSYWAARDPAQVERADQDGHHRMALTFRWYLGMTSRWARTGDPDRRRDYQIWCGPAMGAFNDWVRGTWLDALENRRVADVSWALLAGAAAVRRVEVARALGLDLPPGSNCPPPARGLR